MSARCSNEPYSRRPATACQGLTWIILRKDVAVPLMLSANFPEDTLFICIEEDWRLSDEEEHDPWPEPTAGQGETPSFAKSADGSYHGAHYFEPRKSTHGRTSENSKVLEDIVSICTKASRFGKGEIVWLCWQPAQDDKSVTRKASIRSGAMMIAVDVFGARRLSAAFSGGALRRHHFDCSLLNWLKKDDQGQEFSCYLYPPLGNYKQHISGCEKNFSSKPRPSCWDTQWVCPGTRRADDPKKRDKWLACHTTEGHPKWLGKVDLEKEFDDLEWRLFWEVPGQLRPDIAWAQRGPGAAKASSSACAAEPAAAAAAAEPTAAASSSASGRSTDRDRRRRRNALHMMKFRNWTDDKSQADIRILRYVAKVEWIMM